MTDAAKFKTGIVAEVSGGFVRVQFKDMDNLVSQLIPVVQPATGLDKHFRMPKVGDQVAILMDGHLEDGAVIGSIYSDPDQPALAGDKIGFAHQDGTLVQYDGEAHVAQVAIAEGAQVSITASGVKIKVGSCTAQFSSAGLTMSGGDVVSADVSLLNHVHLNTQPGTGLSGVPQGGGSGGGGSGGGGSGAGSGSGITSGDGALLASMVTS